MHGRARDPEVPAARPGVSFLRALYSGPDLPARPRPQRPGVAHAPGPGAPEPPQPLPLAAATPPAHVTLAPLFPSVRSLGPRLSRRVGGRAGGRATRSVPLVSLGRHPGLSSRETGALMGCEPGRVWICPGNGPRASFVVRGTSWKAHINCKSPLKTFGGGLSLAFFFFFSPSGAPEAQQGEMQKWGLLQEQHFERLASPGRSL